MTIPRLLWNILDGTH